MTKIRLLLALACTCLSIQACGPGASQGPQLTLSPGSGNSGADFTATGTFLPAPINASVTPSRTSSHTVEPSPSSTTQSTPTPYPTYIPQRQTTRQPPPRQACRQADPNYSPQFTLAFEQGPDAIAHWIEGDLNLGATYEQLISAIPPGSENSLYFEDPSVQDLTADGLEEFAIRSLADTLIFGCLDGQYRLLHDEASSGSAPWLMYTSDMNLDGIPDLVFVGQVTSGPITVVNIVEWNGRTFEPLIQACHGDGATETSLLAKALYWYQTNWHPRQPGRCSPLSICGRRSRSPTQ